jgi:hypothetical protein
MVDILNNVTEFDNYQTAHSNDIIGIGFMGKQPGDLHDGHVHLINEARAWKPGAKILLRVWEQRMIDEWMGSAGTWAEGLGITDQTTMIDWCNANSIDAIEFIDDMDDWFSSAQDMGVLRQQAEDRMVSADLSHPNENMQNILTGMVMYFIYNEAHQIFRYKYKADCNKDGIYSYMKKEIYVRWSWLQDYLFIDPLMDGAMPLGSSHKYWEDFTSVDKLKLKEAWDKIKKVKFDKKDKAKTVEEIKAIELDDRATKKLKYMDHRIYSNDWLPEDLIEVDIELPSGRTVRLKYKQNK